MTDAYIGIDLAIAKGKYLPIVISTVVDGRISPLLLQSLPFKPPKGYGNPMVIDDHLIKTYAKACKTYIEQVSRELNLNIKRIAIDAPSSPTREGFSRRACEQALDTLNISCFSTPTESKFKLIKQKVAEHLSSGAPSNKIPYPMQLWMIVGFEFFRVLSKIAPCLEVFPQATVRLIGAGDIHKSQANVPLYQLTCASRYTGWPSDEEDLKSLSQIAFGPTHDRVDAYLCSWIAVLNDQQLVALGETPDDVVWVPRLEALPIFTVNEALLDDSKVGRQIGGEALNKQNTGINKTAQSIKSKLNFDHRKLCPACGLHMFKRWPFGWDAHAAHKCTGLLSSGTEERKAEYKGKYIS